MLLFAKNENISPLLLNISVEDRIFSKPLIVILKDQFPERLERV